jgi:hypothetical protein
MIDVAHDREGLRQAALELMEEQFAVQQRKGQLADCSAAPESDLAKPEAERTLSPAYYQWIGYIVGRVEEWCKAGISLSDPNLDADPDELPAIDALGEARADFEKKHPLCVGCSEPLRSANEKMCDECLLAAATGPADRVN